MQIFDKPPFSPAIDPIEIKNEQARRMAFEVGEWIAQRLIENPELIKNLPPILYAYYKTWIQICQNGFYSDLFEKHFRKYFL